LNALSPTPQQQQAISARGNVLVVAGAGAGKTQTVVDRCLAWLLDVHNDASIDQILMVTFTQAAAAEMRRRLRQNIEAAQTRLDMAGLPSLQLAAQLVLLDSAHIGTLHSFCFQLVSRHFYDLGIAPQTRILPEEQVRLLEQQSLGFVLDQVYSSQSPSSAAIQKLIQTQGGDWDQPTRELILRLHHYTQTLRDPAAWFAAQTALFQEVEPTTWRRWLKDEFARWRTLWLPVLRDQPADNKNAAACAKALAGLPDNPTAAQCADVLAAIAAADAVWPKPKAPWRDPIKNIFDEAGFLASIVPANGFDPLAEDWPWAREPMLALLDLAGQFNRAFQDAKRRESGIDYHDLEQLALRLLWQNGRPSPVALQWRRKFRLVFVDEYQDINEAQEAILQALGGDGPDANRFLVGDVKQSIYGFRLADPRIFAKYCDQWSADPAAHVIPLTENFRSHESILLFINAIFTGLMRRETGGIEYDAAARLVFGHPAGRAHLAARPSQPPPVELHLHCLGRENEEGENAEMPESASHAEMEARLVGRRLLEIKNQPAPLFDSEGKPRAARWSDMVVLLRSPRGVVEAFVKEFGQLGIPISAARGGFYETLEVRDLLALLQVLDNPLQDLPLLGLLRSPLAGLTPADLARIRAGREKSRFWTALAQYHQTARERDALYQKTGDFLRRFESWRKLSRQSAVSHCLETILDQTHYADWIATQERGAQKQANVERFLQLTRQFDTSEGGSLYRFLKFVQAQQDSEVAIEPAAAPESDAVRLMSIHQGKGLEFPIVALAGLGRQFNLTSNQARVILDEEYGLSPQIQPPGTPQFYPSLPHWLARRRQKRKWLGEEMRLLYVALTRAGQRLILAGAARQKAVTEKWPRLAQRPLDDPEIMAARNYLDWLGPWLARSVNADSIPASGRNDLLSWTLYDENDPRLAASPATDKTAAPEINSTAGDFPAEQRDRLLWRYPFPAETTQPAKTSVTTIRRQIVDDDGQESRPLFAQPAIRAPGRLNAAETGLANHTFLQWVVLDRTQSIPSLKEEAARLTRENRLTPGQLNSLEYDALAAFWQSETGRQLLDKKNQIKRELPFTARFSAADLQQLGAAAFVGVGQSEFVIVQGVIDLAVLLPEEIWLLDFKTDRLTPAELKEKTAAYRPQLTLYALALERIHHRPVTKRLLHFLTLRQTISI
jgi:ATP-dependent helicase/nuclease subunit A